MAERIDWDEVRRRIIVERQGSEPSEYPDATTQIAKAKGFSKITGPMLRACRGCGKYYDERYPEDHDCRPPPKPKKVKCRRCGEEVEASCIASHMRQKHPRPRLSKTGKIKCKHCGRMVTLRGLKQHNKSLHSWNISTKKLAEFVALGRDDDGLHRGNPT